MRVHAEHMSQKCVCNGWGWEETYKKAFTWTLCFDDVESRKFKQSFKTKQRWMSHRGMNYMLLLRWLSTVRRTGLSYTISAWGFRVARFDWLGNARALHREASNKCWLHVFCICIYVIDLVNRGGQKPDFAWKLWIIWKDAVNTFCFWPWFYLLVVLTARRVI